MMLSAISGSTRRTSGFAPSSFSRSANEDSRIAMRNCSRSWTCPRPASEQPVRRATRYVFATPIEVHIDGQVGVLVDLSVGGAQVICEREPDMDHVVTMLLQLDEVPVSREGNVVWVRSESRSEGWPPTHRVGIAFTSVDEAAVETFIIRYSTKLEKPLLVPLQNKSTHLAGTKSC